MPGAGSLRERLAFQRRSVGDDGYNNEVAGDFETIFVEPAGMVAKVGGESVMAARLVGRQPYIVTVRQSARTRAVTADWRIVDARDERRVFNIRAIHDPDGKRAWLDMLVEQNVPTWGGGVPAYDAAALFAGGYVGSLLEMDRPETLWRDTAGTLPATSIGVHTLARIDDRSGNANHALQATDSARPLYGQDSAGKPLCAWDYIDDAMDLGSALPAGSATLVIAYDPALLAGMTVGLGPVSDNNPWTLSAQSGSASTHVSTDGAVVGCWVDGVSKSYTTRGEVYTAMTAGSVLAWQWNSSGYPTLRRLGRYADSSDISTPKFRKLMLINRALTSGELADLSAAWKM